MKYRIAESVTRYHPDKICDQISDLILDACLTEDPYSRVAVEAMGGHKKIFLTGEITTKATINYSKIVKRFYKSLMYKEIEVEENIVSQSPEISQGVTTGGAGDQGIMVGYACEENEQKIPQELYLCRQILNRFSDDGKAQVVMDGEKIISVVLSVRGEAKITLQRHLAGMNIRAETYCNNTGSFKIGGFDADAGVTGRKIVVDAYGPRVPVGGGAFSGKDPTKVDRSAAYMARFIAKNALKTHGAKEVLVKIGYVIGKAEPLLQQIIIDGIEETFNYDCRPEAIIERFNLRRPIYLKTARFGHFGIASYPWEKYA